MEREEYEGRGEETARELEYDTARYLLGADEHLRRAVGREYEAWLDRISSITHYPKTQIVNKHIAYMDAMHAVATQMLRKKGRWRETLEEMARLLRADHYHFAAGMRSYGPERERKLMATRITEKRVAERYEEGKEK